jgi:Leu/Phe-tRNA-protein transferase
MPEKSTHSRKKLIQWQEKREFNHLDDFLYTVAECIEEAFQKAGMRPDMDYGYQELFEMALPFALEQWKKEQLEIPFWNRLEK